MGNLQAIVNDKALMTWAELQNIFPRLGKFAVPKIVLSGRFRKNLGLNYYWLNRINLNTRMFTNNYDIMLNEVLPHELAHQAHANLIGFERYGSLANSSIHGKQWAEIMLCLGLFPNSVYYVK